MMQVSVENTGPLERKIRVEVPEEKIAAEIKNRLQSLSRTSKIQGFRPGKAPFKVVQQYYGSRVRQEVIGEVMQSSFYEALAQEQLRPASRPSIDPMDEGQGKGLVYTATFEIYPDVNVGRIEDLTIEKPVCAITAEDVEKMIEVIRRQHRKLEPVAREAREGDVLEVDFTGQIDGHGFEGGDARNFKIELGSKRFIAGFEEGLIGAREGEERTLKLNFPETYYKPELAGKPVTFATRIKTVHAQVMPGLDEEFFANMGVKEGGLEAFRAEVRRNMEREADQALLARSKSNVLEALYNANRLELPKSLIHQEAVRLNEQFHAGLKMRGVDAHHHHDEAAEAAAFNAQAEKKVTLQLLIADIVRRNNIRVETAKVRQMVENVAQSYEHPQEVINWYYSDKGRLAEVEMLALEDEVVNWVLSRTQVMERQFAFDDLMNKVQTENIGT
ncbi:MAG: trigger factor [Gammaproteobacteria bacterium]